MRRRGHPRAGLGPAVMAAGIIVALATGAAAEGAGRTLSFSSERAGDDDIWVMKPNGKGQRNLTGPNARAEQEPDFSKAAGRIAFQRQSGPENGLDIWSMERDGTKARNLTKRPGADLEPAYSPDGKRIAFVREDGDRDIWIMDADGTHRKNLTTDSPANDGQPTFSPDGKKIFFDSSIDGDLDIYSMKVAGSGPWVNHTATHVGTDRRPSLSPDGKRIAFEALYGPASDVFVMRRNGTGFNNVSAPHAHGDFAADFAADGSLAWTQDTNGGGFYDVVLQRRDFLTPTNLTFDGTANHDESPDFRR